MKNYYLEETIDNLIEQSAEDRAEALEFIEAYYKMNFSKEELLELLVRGQIHANEDDRTEFYFER